MSETLPVYPSDNDDSDEEEEYDFNEKFVADALADLAWAKDHYSGRNDEFSRMEAWYHKDHYLSDADYGGSEVMDEATDETSSEHLTTVNTLTNVINQVHGVLFDEDPVIDVLCTANRSSMQKSTAVAALLYGTRWINRQNFGEDAWEMAGLNALVKGWGCVYTYWDPDRAAAAKKRGKDNVDLWTYPIVERNILPEEIYPLPNGVRERWRGMIWRVERTVREVEDEFDVKLNGEPMFDVETGDPIYLDNGDECYEELSPDALVEFVDYWAWKKDHETKEWNLWNCILANGQIVKPPTKMIEYDMLPYEVFFCRTSTSRAAHHMGLSFMYPLIEPVQEMEYIISRMLRMADLYSDPILLVKDGTGDPADIEKEPGTIITVGPDGDAHYITWQGSPPDFGRVLQLERDLAQDAYPPALSGIAGGTSALDTVALQRGGKSQTNRPRRNFEQAMQRGNTKIIKLLQRFSPNEPIQVIGQRVEADEDTSFALSIKGKDTRGYENTAVHIRGRFPNEELTNIALAAQAVGTDLMSARNASKKFLFVQDPDKEFRMRLEEKTIEDPQWRQMFFQMYQALPARSPLTEAVDSLEAPMGGEMGGGMSMSPPTDMMAQIQSMMAAPNAAGGDIASALATNEAGAQSGVQRTAGTSNIFSSIAGGPPPYGAP